MKPAGDFRHHRITIQREVIEKDTNGDDITTWETVAESVPAENKPLSVRQILAADATHNKVLGRFVIRNRPGFDFNARQRAIYRGKAYDLQGWYPDPESGQDYITAPYSLGVNNGGF